MKYQNTVEIGWVRIEWNIISQKNGTQSVPLGSFETLPQPINNSILDDSIHKAV